MKTSKWVTSRALRIVKSFFPDVEKVVDATQGLVIRVSEKDSNEAKLKDHNKCALAVACKRQQAADGVVVSLKTVYVVKGKIAVRYRADESVSREIVSFDRNAGFAAGEYHIRPASKSERLGARTGNKSTGERPNGKRPTKFVHRTANVRTSLNTWKGG